MFNERDVVQRKSQDSTAMMKNSLFTMKATTIVFLKLTLIAQDVQKNQPISMELSKTPQQFQMDLLEYYVATGQIKKVKEVAKHKPDKGLVEKFKYENVDKVLRRLTGGQGLDAVDMFKNIGQLKNDMDELDPNYIFWINCREINNEPSYVFKASDLALQLALKMDPEIQNDKPCSMVEEYAYLDGMHTRVKGYVTLALWTYHPGLH